MGDISMSARLRADKRLQTLRLINCSEQKVKFGFKLKTTRLNGLNIQPKSGTISSRNYILVRIENKYWNTMHVNDSFDLNLIYWFKPYDKSENNNKFKIPIEIMQSDVKTYSSKYGGVLNLFGSNNKAADWITLILRFLRPTFLLALVIYNIILIRVNLYN